MITKDFDPAKGFEDWQRNSDQCRGWCGRGRAGGGGGRGLSAARTLSEALTLGWASHEGDGRLEGSPRPPLRQI